MTAAVMDSEKWVVCAECGRFRKSAARGLCATCYSKRFPKPVDHCRRCGVLRKIMARGCCSGCYQTLKRHDSLDDPHGVPTVGICRPMVLEEWPFMRGQLGEVDAVRRLADAYRLTTQQIVYILTDAGHTLERVHYGDSHHLDI